MLATRPSERAEVKARSCFWIAMHLADHGLPAEAVAHLDRAVDYLMGGGLEAGADAWPRIGGRLLREGALVAFRRWARPSRRLCTRARRSD